MSIRSPHVLLTSLSPMLGGLMLGGLICMANSDALAQSKKAAPYQPSSSLAGNYLAAQHARAARDLDIAADTMAAVLKTDPDNADLINRTFSLFVIEGRIPDAIPLAKKLRDGSGPDTLDILVLAANAIKSGRFQDAVDGVREMKDDGLDAYTRPLFEAWALQGLGKTDQALEALKPLSKPEGARALYHMHAGLIAEQAGRNKTAESHFRSALDDRNGASIRLVEILAAFLDRQGKSVEAENIVKKYIADNGESLADLARERLSQKRRLHVRINTPAHGVAEGLFGIANSLRRGATMETALYLGRITLYLRPDFDMTLIMVGEILESEKRFERAIETYRTINKKSTFHRVALLRIADGLDRLGQKKEAIRAFKEIVKNYPRDPRALINMGDVLRSAENFKDAVKAYDKAFRRIKTPGPGDWRLYYARGIALERTDRWERAEKDFLQALTYRPDQPFVLNYLGYSWIDKNMHLERALGMIRKAVSLRPTDGYIVDSLGWGLYRTGDYKKAVKEMERAARLRPQDPVINDHLGDVYWRLDRKREARFQWERALSLKPALDMIEAIKAKLEKGLKPKNGT